MVVSEGAINNIMGGMENTTGVRLHSHRHKLKQRFDIIRKLGQGTYGKVQLAINKDTGQEVAIKTIKKAKIETEQDLIRIRREIQIMSSVQHPQIIHIYEVFENREKMVLVMEYAAGGELYDYLSERKVLAEQDARRIFRQVSSAVYYCHKHKICHRDLKLENILLDIEGNAKIADFGLSNVFDEKHKLDTFCGSPLYASPEIVKGIKYTGPEVDCWSLGVLLYTLVYGAMPFDGSNFRRLVKQITQGDFYEPSSPSSASELIRHMLTVSAPDRATIEIICNHWWVNEGYTESCLKIAEALANQTPVRLDLLLSLAPKHINSEHMLIQPDGEEDTSQRSDASRAPPQLQLPPPPPPEPTSPQTATRSQSLGAITPGAASDIEQLIEKKRKERENLEKKRHAEEAPLKDKKKIKESDSMSVTPRQSRKSLASGEGDASEKKPPTRDRSVDKKASVRKKEGSSERSERKKSVKKRDSAVDMDISESSEKSEKRKSIKKKEVSVEKDIGEGKKTEKKKTTKSRNSSLEKDTSEGEKVTKKKLVKKRDTSTTREPSEEKQNKTVKKKETSRERSVGKSSQTSVSEEPSVIKNKLNKKDSVPAESQSKDSSIPESCDIQSSLKEDVKDTKKEVPVPEPHKLHVDENKRKPKPSSSNKSVGSAGSGDGTLIGSDSSISRHSVSPVPPKKVISEDTKQKTEPSSTSSSHKINKGASQTKVPKVDSKSKVSATGSDPKINKSSSKEVVRENKSKITDEMLQDDTEKILQETAEKIKRAEEAMAAQQDEQEKSLITRDPEGNQDSTSSKDSSQHTSVMSTPARSRTGSESSTESRSGRHDGSRRTSKIFSKAALWDNMINQNQEKPAPIEKPKKNRVGGLNMSDLAKKFEDKSSGDRKSVVLPSVKVSDARKAFESRSGDHSASPRRKSSFSGGSDSSLSKESSKEGISKIGTTSPTSPGSPTSPISKEVSSDKIKEGTVKKDEANKEVSIKKELSASKLSNKRVSPTKEVDKKEKSPSSSNLKSPSKSVSKEITKIPVKEITSDPKVSKIAATEEKAKKISITEKPKQTSNSTVKEEPPVIVGGLNLKLGEVGKISEVGTSHNVVPGDESDSSDSESEAERVLRLLSEKREKLEAAKREKLRKVSEATKEKEAPRHDMPAIREEPRSKSPSKSPEKGRSTSSDSDQKFATLPRGFKNKYPAKPCIGNQEINDNRPRASNIPISQDENEIRELRESLTRTIPDNMTSKSKSRESTPLKKEVMAIPPSQVLSPTPRDSNNVPSYRKTTDTRSLTPMDTGRKKTQMEIVLDNRPSDQTSDVKKQSSYAEIQLKSTTPTSSSSSFKEIPKTQEFKTEVRHNISSPRNSMSSEPTLQRARRERIIPIMIEDDDETSISESHTSSSISQGQPSSSASNLRSQMPPSAVAGSSAGADKNQNAYTASPEPIRKSRRERIIPIAVEGEGIVTPPPQMDTPSGFAGAQNNSQSSFSQVMSGEGGQEEAPGAALTQRRSQHPLPRAWSKRLHRNNSRGRGFHLDHSESFSSAGEDEEDEEDGFQILTAESLFSTLLNRVRSLTRKMNTEDPNVRLQAGSRRTSQQPTPEPQHPMSGPGSSGFWSQLYSSPRDSPSRRVSEPMSPLSRNSISREMSREDDTLSGIGSPLWSRSMSRDPSDIDAMFSEPNAPFSTLPRGWRSRLSGEEIGESDKSEASNRSSRKSTYSRIPSRELPNLSDSDAQSTWSSSSLPHNNRPNISSYGSERPQSKLRQDYSNVSYDAPGYRKSQERRIYSRYSQDREKTPRYSQDRETTPVFMSNRKISSDREIPIRYAQDNDLILNRHLDREIRMSQDGDRGRRLQNPRPSLDKDGSYMSSIRQSASYEPSRLIQKESNEAMGAKAKQGTDNQSHSGEVIGRDGGQYEQKQISPAQETSPKSNIENTNKISNDSKDIQKENKSNLDIEKTNVQNQLQQLVKELESVPYDQSDTNSNTSALVHVEKKDTAANNSKETKNMASRTADMVKSDTENNACNLKSTGTTITPKTFSFQKRMETEPTILNQNNINYFNNIDPTLVKSIEKKDTSNKESTVINMNLRKENSESDLKKKSKSVPKESLGSENITNYVPTNEKSNDSNKDRNCNGKPVGIGSYMRSKTTLLPDTKKKSLIGSNSAKSLAAEPYKRGKSEDLRPALDSLAPIEKYRRATDATGSKVIKTDPIVKNYCRSKSRELTPAIEAAGEKFNQLNSSTLKKMSPFEAYRKSKSRELAPVLDLLSRNQGINDNSSRGDKGLSPERAKSPFEKAKTSIEKKLVRTKSPLRRARSPSENRKSAKESNNSITSMEKMKDKEEGSSALSSLKANDSCSTSYSTCVENNFKESLDDHKIKEKDQEKQKKTHVEGEKPKSMYQLIASKFNRSQSNVPDDTKSQTVATYSEDENSERDDKFKLKRPSRFLKNKAEKSSSKSNISENENSKCEENERNERKPSKKLSDALNKFLGRRPEDLSKSSKLDGAGSELSLNAQTTDNETSERENPKKPPRFKPKKYSKSQDCLVKPEAITNEVKNDEPGDISLESVTKSICDHINQLENDIGSSSKIKNDIQNQERGIETTNSVPSMTSHGISNFNKLADKPLSPNNTRSYVNSDYVGDNGSNTPTGSDSTTSGRDDSKGQASDVDDESVMDRITRKSYYTRFQEVNKKPKLRRTNTKESIDQQLAVAKARLQQEELEAARLSRDTLSPLRYHSQRASLISPPPFMEGVTRRNSHKTSVPRTASLPPEDGLMSYMGGYRGSSVQPDAIHSLRLTSLSPEKSFHSPLFQRDTENSVNHERVQEAVAAAVAAGAAAGAAAASIMKERASSREKSIHKELIPKKESIIEHNTIDENEELTDINSSNKTSQSQPDQSKPQSPINDEAINSAREELTRRLTPLTRLSNMANKDSNLKNYRRTYTTGRLGETLTSNNDSPTQFVQRPAYRRTNTMDLPPADARVRPGSDYKRFLQEPSRRYSTARWVP